MTVNLDFLIINIIASVVFVSPFLWLSGRSLVGKEKAKFTDAVATVALGTIVGAIFGAFFSGILASIIQVIIWLGLVKHFFDCGWIKAFAISIISIVIFIIIVILLGVLGFSLFTFF
jgi:hypothetical protein